MVRIDADDIGGVVTSAYGPEAGWKGKGMWSNFAGRAPFHIEGGKNTTSKVVKFQLRPDPLAK